MGQISAEIVVGAENLRAVIDGLLTLEGPLRPHSISTGEDETGISLDRLDGRRNYLDRISSNIGFFFFARRGTFLFDPKPEMGWRVFVSDIVEKDALALMGLVTDLPIIFAFASEWEELVFLNQANLSLSFGKLEAWLGKDVRKYLPGIYWITVVPVSRVVDWNELMTLAANVEGMTVRRSHHNICIQLYERAADWRDRALARKVVDLLDGPVFNKADALSQIERTEDFLTLSDKLAEWP